MQTQLAHATWPQDQGRIPRPVFRCRDVALSPSILQAGEGREHQGYLKVGYARSPGLLCGAQAALLPGCCHPVGTPGLHDVPCLAGTPVPLHAAGWMLVAERQQQILGATGPAPLPLTCRGTAGRQRAAPQSLLPSCPAQAALSGQRQPWGPLLLESSRAGTAAPPVPKGLTSNFLC